MPRKKRKKSAPKRPILALLRRRIASGGEPAHFDDDQLRASAAEIDDAVPRPPAWIKRDPEVLSQLDALLWSTATLYDRYDAADPSHLAMLLSWKNLDERLVAGTLTRAAWNAHATRVYEWERHQMVGRALRRRRADERAREYLPAAGLGARRQRAAETSAAYREAAKRMIQRGMSRASAAQRLAEHPPSHEQQLAPSTIRRLIADL